jgi:hypothetical protein
VWAGGLLLLLGQGCQVGKDLHIFRLFRYFSLVGGENRSRRPKYAELKTEAEPKNRKNDISVRFGSVRFSFRPSVKKCPPLNTMMAYGSLANSERRKRGTREETRRGNRRD